jgi:hypothetical protein
MVVVLERHRPAHEEVGGQRELREFDAPVERDLDDVPRDGVEKEHRDHQEDQVHGDEPDPVGKAVHHPHVGPDRTRHPTPPPAT